MRSKAGAKKGQKRGGIRLGFVTLIRFNIINTQKKSAGTKTPNRCTYQPKQVLLKRWRIVQIVA